MMGKDFILIDADDTLWENEKDFRGAEDRLVDLLSPYADTKGIREKLWAKQEENIPYFGYGSKTYLIGMLDTALSLCGGELNTEIYLGIKKIVTELAFHPLQIFDGVEETLEYLSERHTLIMATKGDGIEQLMKARKSGLLKYFLSVEVMPYKDTDDYLDIVRKYGITPENLVMVGNSVRSDIIPAVTLGGRAFYIPSKDIWSHEVADFPSGERAIQLESFRDLTRFL